MYERSEGSAELVIPTQCELFCAAKMGVGAARPDRSMERMLWESHEGRSLG
jgi:hypothetical protein